AAFYDPGDTWAEATPTFDPITVGLKIIGGDADVDNFLQQTYADPNDLEAIVIESRAKSVAHAFSGTFYTGDSSSNAKQFDGLGKLTPSGQTVVAGTDGGALTLDLVDELIDLVKPGRPDALLLHKRTRRKLSSLRRASGGVLETAVDQFGQHVTYYDGIPLLVDDFIPITESVGTGNNLSSIYAVKFGPAGLLGLENQGIQIETVGELETKDATRHRIKWYASLALFSELGIARLQGISAS
ncbi:MAG TPA: phage major capsid protein, partial [Thermomicrobiaceae bacterium]|nr:phage major capsid protein [Thermomicrobiaceae bacterium]